MKVTVILKEIAKKHDRFVTFMPKPTIGDWRSGGHINFSLNDIKSNTNIFKDGEITNMSTVSHSGDFHLKRKNKETITYESLLS